MLLLFLINLLNFYDRLALGAVAEPLRREFHLTDAALGGLTTGFTVIYALAGWPLGRLADTRSRKGLLAWGMGVWCGLTALGGFAGNYLALLLTRLGVGVGEAACAPAATSWIGDAVPPERRARAMAWFMMAVPAGIMLSFAITGPAAQAFGWRAGLALAALPALVLIPAVLASREPKRAAAPATAAADSRELWRLPVFWWIAISGAILNFALYSFSAFFPAFLMRVHHFSVGSAGFWAGIGTGVAGIAGALAAGALGDRVRGQLASKRMRLGAGASLAAAPLSFLALSQPAAPAIFLMMTAYGLLQMYYGLVYAAMHDAVRPGLRGRAMGAYFAVQYLCGAAWGPLLTGSLSDRLARGALSAGASAEAARAIGLRSAMYDIPALALLLATVLFIAARSTLSSTKPLPGLQSE